MSQDDGPSGADADAGADAGSRDERGRRLAQTVGIYALFFATTLGAVALARPYVAAEMQAFSNPSSSANAGLIVVEILVATGLFLLVQRLGYGPTLLRGLLLFVFGYIVAVVASVLVPLPLPALGAIVLGTALVIYAYPEWWVLDAFAVVGGAGMTAQFGISLTPFPIVLLFVVMAAYDAYSVYVSGHMVDLVEGLNEVKVPMVFVVPDSLSYSVRESGLTGDEDSSPAVLGLGDAFFPGLLAVSAMTYVESPTVLYGMNLPAVGALLGGLVGMTGLHLLLARFERAHAGLPMLNGGVLLGYGLACLVAGVPLVTAFGL
jgi:presenilin-like A22 family membrane protease